MKRKTIAKSRTHLDIFGGGHVGLGAVERESEGGLLEECLEEGKEDLDEV